jgi:hypothetical protein
MLRVAYITFVSNVVVLYQYLRIPYSRSHKSREIEILHLMLLPLKLHLIHVFHEIDCMTEAS